MNKVIIVLLVVCFSVNGNSQNKRSVRKSSKEVATGSEETPSKPDVPVGKPFLSPQSDVMKLSTTIELGGYPSDADITIINVYGHLGLNFDIGRAFHIGPYFKHTILNTHEYQILPYEGIEYDVSTLKEWGTGLSLGAYFPLGKAILLNPEMRIGYNEFTIQSPDYISDTSNFIHRSYLNLTPRLNFGFKLSNYTILNVSGGYTLPYLINNPDNVPHYNPSTFMYGLGVRFYLTK